MKKKEEEKSLAGMLAFFVLVAKMIDEIFEDAETKKEIEELKSKKIRFFLKKKLIEKIDGKIAEKMDKIEEGNRKRDKRRPSSQRKEVEREVASNPVFISMGKRIHDEIKKMVEMKLNERISQK